MDDFFAEVEAADKAREVDDAAQREAALGAMSDVGAPGVPEPQQGEEPHSPYPEETDPWPAEAGQGAEDDDDEDPMEKLLNAALSGQVDQALGKGPERDLR